MSDRLRELWGQGGTALGGWLFLREPLVAEAAALSGYDYVCVDMQHGLMDYGHVVTMLYAMARTETTPNKSLMLTMPSPRISRWCLVSPEPVP